MHRKAFQLKVRLFYQFFYNLLQHFYWWEGFNSNYCYLIIIYYNYNILFLSQSLGAMTVCESKNPTKTRKSSLKKRAFTEMYHASYAPIYHIFFHIFSTQEQFEGLSASVRGRTKLPEVNSVLADHLVCRLVLHITEWGPDEREH